MKKTTLLIYLLSLSINMLGQGIPESIVDQFGKNLSDWCSSNDIDYRIKAENLCDEGCRVYDTIIEDFMASSGFTIKNYVIKNYLNAFESALNDGTFKVEIRDIRIVRTDEQTYGSTNEANSYKKSTTLSYSRQREVASKVPVVACNVVITGSSMNYNIRDVYYLKKNKIVRIEPYKEIEDKKTGKKKVVVDFSDLEDITLFGVSINHDQHFPLGFSISGQQGWFMCSLDFGFNLDSKEYIYEKMDFKDVMNYDSEKRIYNPKFYAAVTPSLFIKYVSIGCGIGFGYFSCEETQSFSNCTLDDNGKFKSVSRSTTTNDLSKFKLLIRPQLNGFIPLNDSFRLSIGVGYDYFPGMKDINGYSFSLGVHVDIDGWDFVTL